MSLKFKKRLSLAAVIAVMAMIFCFSAQPGEDSAEFSGAVTETVLTVTVKGYSQMTEEQKQPYRERWGYAVRKLAHFLEFALLAVTLTWHLHYLPAGNDLRRRVLLAWLIATLYAVTDEAHQMFVDARGPSPVDVCIDSLGALTGALASAAAVRFHRRKARG